MLCSQWKGPVVDCRSSERSEKSNDDAVKYHQNPNKSIRRTGCPVMVFAVQIRQGYLNCRCKSDHTNSGEPIMMKDASQTRIAVAGQSMNQENK